MGETGRVVGGFTAVESVECAEAVVIVEAWEFERNMFAASRGRLEELVEAGALGAILAASCVNEGKRAPPDGRVTAAGGVLESEVASGDVVLDLSLFEDIIERGPDRGEIGRAHV